MKNFSKRILLLLAMVISTYATDTVVILDTSGSIEPFKKDIQTIVQDSLDKNIPIIAFGSNSYKINSISDLNIGGTTNLTQALHDVNVQYSNKNIKMVVIYTDGIPNDSTAVIQEATLLKQNHFKICTSYIANNKIVPTVISKISDKIFVSSASDAIRQCNNKQVIEELIGTRAAVKHLNVHKFDF